jgi:hypothetical protein
VSHDFDPRIWETKARELSVQSQPGIHSKSPSQKTKTKEKFLYFIQFSEILKCEEKCILE